MDLEPVYEVGVIVISCISNCCHIVRCEVGAEMLHSPLLRACVDQPMMEMQLYNEVDAVAATGASTRGLKAQKLIDLGPAYEVELLVVQTVQLVTYIGLNGRQSCGHVPQQQQTLRTDAAQSARLAPLVSASRAVTCGASFHAPLSLPLAPDWGSHLCWSGECSIGSKASAVYRLCRLRCVHVRPQLHPAMYASSVHDALYGLKPPPHRLRRLRCVRTMPAPRATAAAAS
jgi:hypothetical protein